MKKLKASRTILSTALLLGFFTLLLIDPEGVLVSGKKAVDLCLNIIIPSLLPFFVISRLILKTGAIHSISRLFKPIVRPLFNLPGQAAFPLIAGWFSGYPAGAKYTTDLYENKLLTKNDAQRLLAFCNNSGPLFIVGAIGAGYFKSSGLGMILLVCHLLASITVGIILGILSRFRRTEQEEKGFEKDLIQNPFSGQMLTDAIVDSMKVLLQISGTIIFFAILVQTLETAGLFTSFSKLLTQASPQNDVYSETLKVFVAGSLEITYGLYLLSISTGIPVYFKILLTAFLCGFGGFSVHTQVTGLCPKAFQLKEYFFGKLGHGIIAAIFTGLFFVNRTTPVMTNDSSLYDSGTSKLFLTVYAVILIAGIISLVRHQLVQFKNR